MFSMKVWITALVMFLPGASAQDVEPKSDVPLVQFGGTLGGDGMDGPMQMPVVAGSRHFSKTQLARGTDVDDDEGVSAGAVLFVPIVAILLISMAYFLIMTERGREVAQSFGFLAPANNKWSKMEVASSHDDDHAKWVKMALDAPLVQQAMTALGMRSRSEPEGTEMNSFGDHKEEQWKPSTADECRRSAEKKLQKLQKDEKAEEKPKITEADDDFDPNVAADKKADVKAEPKGADLIGDTLDKDETASKDEIASKDISSEAVATEAKEESTDLLGKEEDETPKETSFDPIQIEPSTTDAVAVVEAEEEEDTTAAFMANRGGGPAMSPEDFLKSLSAPVPAPVVQAAPIEKISTPFSMNDDELLGEVFSAPAPACLEQAVKTVEAAPEAAPAPAFDKISTVFNFDDDDDF